MTIARIGKNIRNAYTQMLCEILFCEKIKTKKILALFNFDF